MTEPKAINIFEDVDKTQASEAVLERLKARYQARTDETSRKHSENEQNADPRESVASFLTDFGNRRDAITAQLTTSASSASKSDLDNLAIEIDNLQELLSKASYFLPQYELRQATANVTILRSQLEQALSAFQPRRRFAFNKKVQQPPPASTSAAPRIAINNNQNTLKEVSSSSTIDISNSSPGTTIIKSSTDIQNKDVSLRNLQKCTIHLQGSLSALFIHNISDCIICVGPVCGATFIEDASNCRFYLASRQVRIHTTTNSQIYLRTLSNPIIEHSNGLGFGPYIERTEGEGEGVEYGYWYEGLEEELEAAGMGMLGGDGDIEQWKMVQDFGWLRTNVPSTNWKLISDHERVAAPSVMMI